MASAAKKSSVRVRLDFHGPESEAALFYKKWGLIQQRHNTGGKSTNLQILQDVFNYWLTHNPSTVSTAEDVVTPQEQQNFEQRSASFKLLTPSESEAETVHLVAKGSLRELEQVINNHGKKCSGYLSLDVDDITVVGYWNRFMLKCTEKPCSVYGYDKFKWSTSPYISPSDSFISQRIKHAANVAGLLPSQLATFTNLLNIVSASTKILAPTSCKTYSDCVIQVIKKSEIRNK